MSTKRDKPNSSGRNAVSVGVGIMFSRLFGVVRESLLGAYLGTRTSGDAFGAALRIPKLLQNLLGEGALSASFIPVYSKLLDEGDEKNAQSVAGAVLGLLVILVGALVALTIFLARPLTFLLAPGFSGEKYELTITLLQIMAPGIGFIVLGSWCLGVLNAHRRFFLSYLAPAIWSTAIIVATAIAAINNFSESSLAKSAAWGVMIGGFFQFLIQIPQVLRVLGHIRITFNLRLQAVRQVFKRFLPAVAGRGVITFGSYVDLILASLLAGGAVAILDRSQALFLLPISIFVISIAAADLPEISREQDSMDKVQERLMKGAERIIFFLLFMTMMFVAGGHTIVSAIYERVNFTSDDTLVVWLVLAAYSLGMVATGIARLLQNTAFGLGDVRNPAIIGLIGTVFSIACGAILMLQFDGFGVANGAFSQTGEIPTVSTEGMARSIDGTEFRHLGAVGLALGTTLAAWLRLNMLRNLLQKRLGRRIAFSHQLKPLIPAALVSGIMAGGLAIVVRSLPGLLGAPIVILPAGLVYLLMAGKRGNLQAQDLLRPVRSFLSRPKA